MEKRMFFFCSTGVPRKQGAEALGLGLMGLAGSAMSSSAAESNNRQVLAFNKWSQLQAQDYQTQMYNQQRLDQENFYKKYQSPQAIAQALSQLGVNPAVALSGGHGVGASPAAMPSGMSSPALSAPALENTGEHWAKGLTNITSSIAQLSSASKTNAEAQQILQTMPEVVRQYILDNQGKEIANAYNGLMLKIQQTYGDSKAAVDLTESLSRTFVNWSQGNLNEAATELQKIQKKIADKEFNMKEIEAANFQFQISYLLKRMQLENDYIFEQTNTEKTKQSLNRSGVAANYASAVSSRAQARLFVAQASDQDMSNSIRSFALSTEKLATLKKWQKEEKISMAEREQAVKMFNRYSELNKNDKNAAANYLNYMLWWFKEECPDIPMMLMKF